MGYLLIIFTTIFNSMIYSNLEDAFLQDCFESKVRPDGRELFDFRKLQVEFLPSRGKVELRLGNTTVLAKTTLDIVAPRGDRSSEGFITCKIDTSIKGEESRKLSIEINTLLERIIKESGVLDPQSLCITSNKYVWSVTSELFLISDDGNVIDAMILALVISLMDVRKPGVKVEKDSISVNNKEQMLSIHFIPVSFTFGLYETAVFLDPIKKEEMSYNGRVTITMNIYKDILSVHKPGGEPLASAVLKQLVDVCEIQIKDRVEQIRNVLQRRVQG